MLLLDEADKASARTWRHVLRVAKNTTWRAGFSGTFPDDTLEDLQLDELMGPVVQRLKNLELVSRGISAKPSVEVHVFNTPVALGRTTTDWWHLPGAERRAAAYDHMILHNEARHAFIASKVRAGVRTVVVVNRIDHGRALQRILPDAHFLDGSATDDERSDMLQRFRNGAVSVLIVTKILDRGTNELGTADDLIFAAGEGSATQILQRIGRGLRRANKKAALRLVDIADRGLLRSGDGRRERWAAALLHAALRRRLQVYSQEGFDVAFPKQSA
jgi:superfamily II DNA or RNA helicase